MEAAAQPVIKVAAICGSLRKGSYNRGLIRSAIQLTKKSVKGMEIEYLDISPLPMLNTDLEVDGTYPPLVEAFRKKILAADCYLFASPEYNYSVTGPLKNAIDWASRPPNVWADKAAAIVSAGGGFGGGRAQYQLRQIGVYLDLHFINKPEFFLNAFAPPAKFDSEGNLIDEATKEKLKEILIALRAFTLRLQGQRESSPIGAFVFPEDFDDVEDDKHSKDFRRRNSPPIDAFIFPEDLDYDEDDKQLKDFESPIDAFIFPEDLDYGEDDKQPKDFGQRNSPPIDAFVFPEDFDDDEDAKQTEDFRRKNSPPIDVFIFPEDLDDDEDDDALGCEAHSMPINHERRSDCQQGSM